MCSGHLPLNTTEASVSQVNQIALEYLEAASRLDPVSAFTRGDLRFAAELTDYSPEGESARAELARTTLGQVRRTVSADGEKIGRDAMLDRLQVIGDLFDSQEWLHGVNVFGPQVEIRQSFDLMPLRDDSDWSALAAKMALVPRALAGFQATLRDGMQRGQVDSRRLALACAAQTRTWAGTQGKPGYFATLISRYRAGGSSLERYLGEGAAAAQTAYLALTRFLEDEYAKSAPDSDGVGPERYPLHVRRFLGVELDLAEAYQFGWSELDRLEQEMAEVAERIAPGQGIAGAIAQMEGDPARVIEGEDSFRAWNQELLDATVAQLSGRHFDIPDPVRRVEAMIAPPGGSPAMYYTPPSLDFSRPGRTWYPTLGRTRFPLWTEVSTAYHEGLPGHHLQLAQICYINDQLNPFQTLLGAVSGHTEGWALYAERLMDELGYLDKDDYRLGMLAAQAMRAARVVVDIGLHLRIPIPTHQRFHPGENWSWELAVQFMMEKSRHGREFCAGEVDRYLGVPAQAISYKVGERVWLEARESARRNCGPRFNLKAFHKLALNLGCIGLDQLRDAIAKIGPDDMPLA